MGQLTAQEIKQLTQALIGQPNEMSQDGIVVQVEKSFMGDTILNNCGLIRKLVAKLNS